MNHSTPYPIAYGSNRLTLDLPAHTVHLAVKEPSQRITQALLREKLHDFLQKNPLNLTRPVLVLADKTRLCGYPEYLPIVLDVLKEQGMDAARLKIIIGYGTHARQSDGQCRQAYGPSYDRYAFIHHDCTLAEAFTDSGVTSRGTPIRFRHDLLAASAIISMGAISHHYFAGYGGGRKLVFPGCGEREAIYANHGLYLDRAAGTIATGCRPGILAGNPLAEDLFEIEQKLPVDLAIHGILDSHGRLCDLLVGKGRQGFAAACRQHGENCEMTAGNSAVVVASCGGYPKDINFIQSHKAVHNAAMFVADGGLLLVYGECRDGLGSTTFLPWFGMGSFAAAFAELARNYQGNGGTALAMMTKLQRIRIAMVTALDDTTCRLIGVQRWSHERVNSFVECLPPGQSLAFIDNAGLSVKKNQG